ncbi:MAG: rubrerythrin family protein [Actinobacteria bacterium]|nr:rubrerythrin family protein [Actinomycetota bacterium]
MAEDKTQENLHTAFTGESKAAIRLKVYAQKALDEEYDGPAKLFRAISESEAIHARNNLKMMGEIDDTETNLHDSLAKEQKVAAVAYLDFLAQAENDGNENAARMFSWARDVEETHAKLYDRALTHLIEEEIPAYYVCDVCGYVSDGRVPDKCPVCGSPAERFFEVE